MELTSIVIPSTHVTRGKTWINLAKSTYIIQQFRKLVEEKEEHYLNALKNLSQEESSRGGEFKFTKIDRKGVVNYKEIPALQSILRAIDLEKYRGKSSTAWKLTKE